MAGETAQRILDLLAVEKGETVAVTGGLRVEVAGTFALAEAGKAQDRSATGHVRGKLILHP